MTPLLRAARAADAEAISALIQGVAHAFTLHPDGLGAERFLEAIAPAAIAGYIADPAFDYVVAEVGGRLAGVVALRDNRHLYHLFVAPPFQRRGLARRLWQLVRGRALAAGNPGVFTVKATPYAVPVYRAFGFTETGPRVETQGIAFVPMALAVAPDRGATP